MNKQIFVVSALAATLALSASTTFAADEGQQQIYGSQLMTQQERVEYRDKMRVAKTAEERERIRAEHHKMMQARAEAQGVTLPDEPPARGQGMGSGKKGMGPGDGMGHGTGMGHGDRGMGSGGGAGSGGGRGR